MHRILLAYRAGDSARRAMYAAAQLARAVHAQVGVISVVPLYPDRGGESVAPWDGHEEHREDLREAQAVFRASGIEPDLIERVGHPATLIDYEATTGAYDTIVLGGRPKTWLDRLLHGSVTHEVVGRSSAKVVVVP
jgi:nucleotide-binding universal stress UspA family protein